MENPTKKRKSPDLDINSLYSQIGSKIIGLSEAIHQFTTNFETPENHKLVNALDNLKNKIPTIVVWGAQSSGKSTLLNKLFNQNLKVNNQACTSCPVLLKLGPKYQGKYTSECYFNNKYLKTDFNNLNDAQTHAYNFQYQTQNFTNLFITAECKHSIEITVIDLPGCNNEASRQSYYSELRNKYLDKPETIIIHVMKGDSDPGSDISTPWLIDIKGTIITTLMHTDVWLEHRDKIRLDLFAQIHSGNELALINNKEKEVEIINTCLKGSIEVNKTKLIGSKALLQFLYEQINIKIGKFIPIFKHDMKNIESLITKQFSIIKRTKPDFKTLCVEFRTVMCDRIKSLFNNSGTQFSLNINKLRDKIGSDKFYEIIHIPNIIPSIESFAVELRDGSRRTIQGAEGWDSLLKKYINILVATSKKNILDEYINAYFNLITEYTNSELTELFNPYSKNIQTNIAAYNKVLHQEFKTNFVLTNINNFIAALSIDPYNDVADYQELLYFNSIKDIVVEVIKYFHNQGNKATAIQEALIDPNNIIGYIAKSNHLSNPYIMKAKQAQHHLNSFWAAKSKHLHTTIIELITRYERLYEDKISEHIQMIEYTEFNESEEVDQKRSQLLAIETSYTDIQTLIRNL